jgi:hypothetical protein
MPAVTVSVPHSLGTEEAVRRINASIEAAKAKHGDKLGNFDGQWTDATYRCSFSAMGVKVQGTVAVEPAAVNVRADVPLMAMMFKGMIEKAVRDEFAKLLA